jgi:hypothetical protein
MQMVGIAATPPISAVLTSRVARRSVRGLASMRPEAVSFSTKPRTQIARLLV